MPRPESRTESRLLFPTRTASAADADGYHRVRLRAARRMAALCLLAQCCGGCAYTGNLHDYVRKGFKVGPEYCKPAAPVADRWIDQYDERVRPELPNYADWWLAFNDPVMSGLISDMYRQNLTLRVAGLRVLEARYLRAIAVGTFFPQVQETFGSFSRNQLSKNTFDQQNLQNILDQIPGSPQLPRLAFNNWALGMGVVWEVDVWGKFRRGIESADASLDASVEEYDAILVSLLAETATAYVDLRTAQQRLEYARSNVEIQEGSLRIADVRFRNGATTELDVTQARTNLENTSEFIPLLENQVRLANNRLCVLLGIPPRDLTAVLGSGLIPTAATEVAVGIPANLLRRRPDVRQAEREVAAQSARIGVATADLLPHFSISGVIDWQAEDFSDLLEAKSQGGQILPGFNWDVLNYGRLLNNVRVQDARFQQLAVTYQETVLQAQEEAENAINSFLKDQEALRHVRAAVDAANRSVELAIAQYRDGATDFNRVFNLQTVLVQQQDRLAEVQGLIAADLIAIYKALGGGWEIRYGLASPPEILSTPDAVPAADQVDRLPPVPGEALPGEDAATASEPPRDAGGM
jgi:NodT family efflux transporter outer membrane factor (OMF) lipoprotein